MSICLSMKNLNNTIATINDFHIFDKKYGFFAKKLLPAIMKKYNIMYGMINYPTSSVNTTYFQTSFEKFLPVLVLPSTPTSSDHMKYHLTSGVKSIIEKGIKGYQPYINMEVFNLFVHLMQQSYQVTVQYEKEEGIFYSVVRVIFCGNDVTVEVIYVPNEMTFISGIECSDPDQFLSFLYKVDRTIGFPAYEEKFEKRMKFVHDKLREMDAPILLDEKDEFNQYILGMMLSSPKFHSFSTGNRNFAQMMISILYGKEAIQM